MKTITFRLLSLFLVPQVALGAIIQSGEQLSITLPINDDLYAGGGEVRIENNVDGDFVAAGGLVEVRGNIEEDVIVAGGQVVLYGNVGDDIRIAGGEVRIAGTIGDDLIIAGGRVEIEATSVVKGDIKMVGGDIIIRGTVEGSIDAKGGRVSIYSPVGNGIEIAAEEIGVYSRITGDSILSGQKLTTNDNTFFDGNVRYWLDGQTFNSELVAGELTSDDELGWNHEEYSVAATGMLAGLFFFFFSIAIASAILTILLLILLTDTYFPDAAKQLHKHFGKSLLYGFLYFVFTPVIATVCIITIIGFPIGLLVFAVYGFSFYFAKPLTAIVLAKWLEKYWKKKWNTFALFAMSVGMYLLLHIVSLIPILGWLAVTIVVLASFGACISIEYKKYMKVR